MTAKMQKRDGIADSSPAHGGQNRSGWWSPLDSSAWVLTVAALFGAAQAAEPAKFTNLTPEQAQTLLALAHDYHPRDAVPEAHYTDCVAPYDRQAANAEDRQQIDEALSLVEGAVRRMGYRNYAEITDDYERMRLARMLGEKQWMKQFRVEVGQCLDRVASPR